VKQATPAVKLTSSASTVVYGASVTLTAILSGTGAKPSGTVAFYNGATPIGTSTLNASGVATLRITTLPVGANSIKASYGGNANYVAATSTATTVTIGKGTQTIAFTTPTTPVKYGVAPIVLIATGGASGLPVTFTVTGPASVSGGALTITGAGSVAVTANQAGNSNYAAAAAVSRTITVNKATPANILNPGCQRCRRIVSPLHGHSDRRSNWRRALGHGHLPGWHNLAQHRLSGQRRFHLLNRQTGDRKAHCHR
jgi:hypothetical protein